MASKSSTNQSHNLCQSASHKRSWLDFLALANFLGVCVVVILQYIIPLIIIIFFSLSMFFDALQDDMGWLEGILNYYSIVTRCSIVIMFFVAISNFIVLLKLPSSEDSKVQNRNLLWIGGNSFVMLLITARYVFHLSLPRQDFLAVAILVVAAIFNSKLGNNIRIRNLSAADLKIWRGIIMLATGLELLLLAIMSFNLPNYIYLNDELFDSNATVLNAETLNI